VTNLNDQPFVLLGVHVGGLNARQLKEVMDKEKLPWRSFADAGNAGAGPIARSWNHSSTPTFFLIDHKGVIRFKWVGVPGETVLDAAIDKLLKAVQGNGNKPPP
jgi:peroxiredoxin